MANWKPGAGIRKRKPRSWLNFWGRGYEREASAAERLAHRALLEKRSRLAIVVGTCAFTLNTIEPWLAFHNLTAVKIQLAVASVLIAMASFLYTPWGRRYPLTLFTLGFLFAFAGFHFRAFKQSYSAGYTAGFPIFFAFHCTFIPVTLLHSALAGIAALAIVTLPDVLLGGRPEILLNAVVANSAAFFLLLYWRWTANRAWENEFRAREREHELISLISHHEIRTPLSTVCLISEELEAGNINDEVERQKYYRALVEESGRLRRISQSMRDFIRIYSEAAEYRFETIDVAVLMNQAAQESEDEFRRRGYRVEMQLPAEPIFVSASQTAFRSVLWNLMNNAMKYSPESKVIWLSLQLESGRAAIRVRDQGVGIPEAELPKIFGKFVRGASATKMGIQGTGIGLAIVKHLVYAHRGEIQVESAVGKGSTFTVLLPAMKMRGYGTTSGG